MENNFAQGMNFKLPPENAPEFVKGRLSIKLDEFVAWAQNNASNGWINLDLKVGRSGKPYVALNTWKPKDESHVPF